MIKVYDTNRRTLYNLYAEVACYKLMPAITTEFLRCISTHITLNNIGNNHRNYAQYNTAKMFINDHEDQTRWSQIWQGHEEIWQMRNHSMELSYAKEILSIYSIIFARWQHASRSWSWSVYLGRPCSREEEVVGGQRWRHSKERWWFPIGSPLWLLRYL